MDMAATPSGAVGSLVLVKLMYPEMTSNNRKLRGSHATRAIKIRHAVSDTTQVFARMRVRAKGAAASHLSFGGA